LKKTIARYRMYFKRSDPLMFNADDFLVECMSIALTCDQNDETVPKISSRKCHHDDIRGVFSMSFQYSKFMIRRVIRESLRIEI